MAVDISGLNLGAIDQVDFDNYQEGVEFQPPPDEGTYWVQVPDHIKFSANKEGQLRADLNPLTITDTNPQGVGYRIWYTRVSTNKYAKRNGSPTGDYLRSHGISPSGQPTAQQYADLIESTSGRIAPVATDWEAYCRQCSFTLKGQSAFPQKDDGTRSYRGRCGRCKREIFARLRVKRFVSAVQQQ
jgi:hypothetical protein